MRLWSCQGRLEDHGLAGLTKLAGQERPEGAERLSLALGQHHAFARREAISLQHDGVAKGPVVNQRLARCQVGDGVAGGTGNTMPLHEGFGEGLAAFQVSGGGVVTEDRDA